MIGKTVSHYKILEKLGEGGMGVVYKAEDTKLKRTVALKFLPPDLMRDVEAKKRFMREAQAAAALDHPNICTVYEVDETGNRTYIVMAYVEGESLKQHLERGPLELGEALDIAAQAAKGLKAAHAKEIIHRDIKSANVMVTPEGRAKIMDFGLAKTAKMTKVTQTGTTPGTVAYMSPEQLLGQPADHQTDIWSLGVVLYEMLTGQLPFKGDYDPALVYSIVNEKPVPVTTISAEIPLEVEQVVGRTLTKDLEKRYQRVEELISDLEELRESLDLLPRRSQWQLKLIRRRKQIAIAVAVVVMAVVLTAFGIRFFSGGARPIDSIAVLPLENLSGDPSQEYFADGITDELIKTLSKISAISVISRTSVMQYKDTKKPLPEIAAELGVGAIVEGSVLHVGDSVRITVQLVEAATDRHLWADSYDREVRNILALHSVVALAIAREIQVTLTPQEQAHLASVRPVNPEAYELYLRGRYYFHKWEKEGTEKAIEYFQQAIEIEPNYAQAHAGLARCYLRLSFFGLSLEEARSRANPPLQKVFEIDDTLPELHYIVAAIKHYFDWDWAGAEMGYKRAIALDPSFADVHFDYAYLLMEVGRFEEAIAEAKRAIQLDPVSYIANKALADMYTYSRQYDQAIAQWQQIIEMEPNDSRPHWGIVSIYERMGRYEDAVRVSQKAMTLSGAKPEEIAAKVAALDSAYSESGPRGYWMLYFKRLEGRYDRDPTITAFHMSVFYAQLADKDQAFVWLEKAYEKHDGRMILLKVEPCWDPLRDDPRFQDLMRRMNFPEDETQ
ncbi:MAG: protein kinase [bacterium]|nr:MAG: protein kinase [bacterium]